METLRLTTIQTQLHWEDPEANRQHFTQLLNELPGKTDVVVLPEMFTSGFTMNAAKLAEEMDGTTTDWMRKQAFRLNAVVTGSFIVHERGRYFNRLVWMRPDGHFSTYDKRHLFTLAKEEETYTAGRNRLVVKWKGWKICPLICYDLRFPMWSRNSPNGYDLLIYVANWPARRRYAWKHLLLARAIENQCYTVGVNRIGTDGKDIEYTGDTTVVDFTGQPLFQSSSQESIHTVGLAPGPQTAFRARYNFLKDKDSFTIDN
jgi:omega-amidase